MATEAIFRLLSLGKEGHVISSPLLFSFPCAASPVFHWVSRNAQPAAASH